MSVYIIISPPHASAGASSAVPEHLGPRTAPRQIQPQGCGGCVRRRDGGIIKSIFI